jgi:hypothetical protein
MWAIFGTARSSFRTRRELALNQTKSAVARDASANRAGEALDQVEVRLSLPKTPSARTAGRARSRAADLSSCRSPLVSVVQSTHLWECDHTAELGPLDPTGLRGIARQGQVATRRVVVPEVPPQDSLEVDLVQYG